MKQTFKTFLEARVQDYTRPSENISFEELHSLFKGPYKEAWEDYQAGYILYRGAKKHGYQGEFDPSTGIRTSANTSNYYTLFFDTNQENANWPKRGKSFICTANKIYAKSYGTVYVVLPHNGVDLGVCPSADLWFNGLRRGYDTIGYHILNKIIAELEQNRGSPFTDFLDFAKYLRSLNSEEFTAQFESPFTSFDNEDDYEEFIENWINIYNFSDYSNGFELVDSVRDIPEDREVWLSGKCLLLTPDTLEDYIEWTIDNADED